MGDAYKTQSGIAMNYQSIGSGGGIAQIKAGTIDFGASDMPLAADDLKAAGLMQFPAIVGGVVPVMNLDGVAPGAMRFTGPVLADRSRSRATGGTGLGLAIVKHVLLRHQAEIEITSERGKGSTFGVRLPAQRVERVGAPGDAAIATQAREDEITSNEAPRETGS